MKKVCHLSSVHTTFDTRIFHKECVSLTKEYEVHLVIPAEKDEVVNNVSIHHIDNAKTSRFKRMTSRVWQVYKKAKKVDAELYHFHDPELIPVGLVLKLKGKKVIYDVHEDYQGSILSKYWIKKPLRKFISRGFNIFEKTSSRYFDYIIVVHRDLKDKFLNYNKNIEIIYNYPIFKSDISISKVKNTEFVWLGGFTKIRGSEQVLKAFQKAGLKLNLIGKLPENDKNNSLNCLGEYNYVDAMNLASKFFVGLVTYLPEPNHINALPNKLFEYMYLGIAVIASDFPKWEKIVNEAKCGFLINPFDIDTLSKKLIWMKNHPEEVKIMGNNGRKTVLEKYNWNLEEKKLLKLYSEVLS